MILSLDRQVTNYEISHDLVQADVAMNTMYFWVMYLDGRIKVETAAVAKRQHRFCSAYTSAELGHLLPSMVKTYWRYSDMVDGPQWFCTYTDEDCEPIETRGDTEADTRALMLLEILKLEEMPKTAFMKHYED